MKNTRTHTMKIDPKIAKKFRVHALQEGFSLARAVELVLEDSIQTNTLARLRREFAQSETTDTNNSDLAKDLDKISVERLIEEVSDEDIDAIL